MKLIFFLLVLLENGMNSTADLSVLYSSEEIILKYLFYPYDNTYEIACCKLNHFECSLFVNNRRQFAPQYKGRIFITNYDDEFEVKITNLSIMDAGRYRCGVRRFPVTYKDVEVTFSAPLSPKSSITIKPTVWPSSPSAPIVSEDGKVKLSESWRESHTLAAVLSVLAFAVISMTLLVYRLKTRKQKSTDESERCGSPNAALEQNGIIYTTVEFQPFQDSSELYANLQIHNSKDTDNTSNCSVTVEESVLYSTIMRAPA